MAISLVPNLGVTFGFLMMWYKENDGSEGIFRSKCLDNFWQRYFFLNIVNSLWGDT